MARSLLERSDRPEDPRARAMASPRRWNPEAGLFHTATKDVRFWSASRGGPAGAAQARRSPMPEPVKRYRGARHGRPSPAGGGDVRRGAPGSPDVAPLFDETRLTLQDLATLLGLSAGVQQWVRERSQGPAAQDVSLRRRPPSDRVLRRRQGRRGASSRASITTPPTGMPSSAFAVRCRPSDSASYYPSSGYFAKAPAQSS